VGFFVLCLTFPDGRLTGRGWSALPWLFAAAAVTVDVGLVVAERTVGTQMRAIFQKMQLEDTGDSHRRVLAASAYLTR
jgi:hypothetical protein